MPQREVAPNGSWRSPISSVYTGRGALNWLPDIERWA